MPCGDVAGGVREGVAAIAVACQRRQTGLMLVLSNLLYAAFTLRAAYMYGSMNATAHLCVGVVLGFSCVAPRHGR